MLSELDRLRDEVQALREIAEEAVEARHDLEVKARAALRYLDRAWEGEITSDATRRVSAELRRLLRA